MLSSLLDIEVAYNLLKSSNAEGKDPIDSHYEQLNTEISVLNKSSNEYKILEKYVAQTHASTHTLYKLEIQQVIVRISSKYINKRATFIPRLNLVMHNFNLKIADIQNISEW